MPGDAGQLSQVAMSGCLKSTTTTGLLGIENSA